MRNGSKKKNPKEANEDSLRSKNAAKKFAKRDDREDSMRKIREFVSRKRSAGKDKFESQLHTLCQTAARLCTATREREERLEKQRIWSRKITKKRKTTATSEPRRSSECRTEGRTVRQKSRIERKGEQ